MAAIPWLSRTNILDVLHIEGSGNNAAYVAKIALTRDLMQWSAPGFISADEEKKTKLGMLIYGKLTLPVVCNKSLPLKVEGTGAMTAESRLYFLKLEGQAAASGSVVQRWIDCSTFDPQIEGELRAYVDVSGKGSRGAGQILRDLLGTFWSVMVNVFTAAAGATLV